MAGEHEQRQLSRLCDQSGVRFFSFVKDLTEFLGGVDAVVCMGGYNTLAESLSNGVPTVCVPRVHPRTEQLIRAHAFAAHGLLRVIEPSELSVKRLKEEIGAA